MRIDRIMTTLCALLLFGTQAAIGQQMSIAPIIQEVFATKRARSRRLPALLMNGAPAKATPKVEPGAAAGATKGLAIRSADPSQDADVMHTGGLEREQLNLVYSRLKDGIVWPVVAQLENLLRERNFSVLLGREKRLLMDAYLRLGLYGDALKLYSDYGDGHNMEPYALYALSKLGRSVPGSAANAQIWARGSDLGYRDIPEVLSSFLPSSDAPQQVGLGACIVLGLYYNGGVDETASYWVDMGIALDPSNPRLCQEKAWRLKRKGLKSEGRAICDKGIGRAAGALRADLLELRASMN